MVAALMGFVATQTFGYGVVGIAAGVGFAITTMMLTDTVHPPAGANPIVVAVAHPSALFLIVPVLAGATAIVLAAGTYRKFTTWRTS